MYSKKYNSFELHLKSALAAHVYSASGSFQRKEEKAAKFCNEVEPSYQRCLECVGANGLILKHIPPHFITAELVLAAVTESGIALQYVANDLKTREVCKAAVQANGSALRMWLPRTPNYAP